MNTSFSDISEVIEQACPGGATARRLKKNLDRALMHGDHSAERLIIRA